MANEIEKTSKDPRADLRFVRLGLLTIGLTAAASALLLIGVTIFGVFCVPGAAWARFQPLQTTLIQILTGTTAAMTTGAMGLLAGAAFGPTASSAVRGAIAAISRSHETGPSS